MDIAREIGRLATVNDHSNHVPKPADNEGGARVRPEHDAVREAAHPAPTAEQIRRWRRYLAEERMERETYLDLAKRRGEEERAILEALADAECRHEKYWLDRLGEHAEPAPRAPIGARTLARLARTFGSIFVLALAQRAEQRQAYDEDEDATAQMAADEHIHGEVVRGLAARSRERMSGMFRAGVFGANDGLVSNLALTLGIAATGTSHGMVVAAGTAGLLAGALSMAAGEYISVTSQRELLEASDPAPNTEAAIARLDVHANELELVFRARGESAEQAAAHAQELLAVLARSSGTALPTHRHVIGAQSGVAKRAIDSVDVPQQVGTVDVPGGNQGEDVAPVGGEHGVDVPQQVGAVDVPGGNQGEDVAPVGREHGVDVPQQLGAVDVPQVTQDDNAKRDEDGAPTEEERHAEIGTALGAAGSSFVFFAFGALLPLLPFLVGLSGSAGMIVATAVVGVALMITGGIVGILSGKPPMLRALRQLAVGYGAAAVTYALGLAFGASGVG